jgi:hypothetical protein
MIRTCLQAIVYPYPDAVEANAFRFPGSGGLMQRDSRPWAPALAQRAPGSFVVVGVDMHPRAIGF